MLPSVNACTFCKKGKRKCNKARPSCSNCVRLERSCVYTEDNVETSFAEDLSSKPPTEAWKLATMPIAHSLTGIDYSNHDDLQKSTVDMVMRRFGSFCNIITTSREFFTGTHQRVSAISRIRFDENLLTLTTRPRADFAALCLTILLAQQTPTGKATNMQSSLYFAVNNLVTFLEARDGHSLDLTHCRLLVTFYEMGHGLYSAASVSLAGCVRACRALGLHKKPWRNTKTGSDKLVLEEQKRIWWEIVLMDRFINLCNQDSVFVSGDPERSEPLPIEDLFWSESSSLTHLERLIDTAPRLDTPFSVTVGQMARECQISHLVGHVIRHVFDPVPDPRFNAEEAAQVERTLRAYLPLLSNEELKIGKYCGAYGICNSALFMLYEYRLNQDSENSFERARILQLVEDTAQGALTFAAASYGDIEGNYPSELFSPYLPHSLCQAAMVYHRLWTQTGQTVYRQRLHMLKAIVGNFTKRWMVGWQYLEAIDKLDKIVSPINAPISGAL